VSRPQSTLGPFNTTSYFQPILNVPYSFSRALQNACDKSDADVEPHPLWEYPCTAVGAAESLMKFDFNTPVPTEKIVKQITLLLEKTDNQSRSCNGTYTNSNKIFNCNLLNIHFS
jgi:hypothetical protein